MKRYILTLLAALFLLVNGVYAQTTSYDSKKGDLGISVTFNPASLAYSMSCQPAPGDFAGEYISDLAGNPKQMFILAQDPLAALRLKYYTTDKSALRFGFGFNGSVVKYREYVQDDLAVALNPESQNKVTDAITSRLNSLSLSVGWEGKVGSPKIKFVYGFDLLYALAGGRMVFDYGNAMTDLNHVPSSMPMTTPKGTLDDFKSKLGIDYARPVERYNSGYIHGLGVQADAGLEFFVAPKIALGVSMTFTPLMVTFQPKTYATYEGFSANTGKVEQVTDVVSPGSCALLYGTQNLGCRIALTYYL
ncbi:MAG: hypothetical protein IJA09_01515 [Bacteroidales bacterium]|nr:hypothetical protein [Bacteroidales bacterium]MBQ3576726.1 hypothetical protein [Coprobacter sp.]